MILNDNCMSICPRVGNLASYLDRVRSTSFYSGFKTEMTRILTKVPMLGDPAERFLAQLKEAIKAGLHGGMLFEELGFRYIGPIDGHDLTLLRKYLRMVKKSPQPVLLHVITEKGHGFQPAAQDPVFFHTPPVLDKDEKKPKPSSAGRTYTHAARDAIQTAMAAHSDVTVLTAAMCQGNKLEPVREAFPDRFFDTGICESHTVAFAAGQAKAGLRPIVDIYSTFLQRSFDQIFQEVALQGLPVVFMLDRAGLTGPDGPTHHGVFDVAYQRIFPGMTVMAPGDARELSLMLEWALAQDGPVSIRYPKTTAFELPHKPAPVERGRGETLLHGSDAVILAFGALLKSSYDAAERLRRDGFDVGLVNARFAKPLDTGWLEQVLTEARVVVTVEEGCLGGGFGSAVLEWRNEQRLAPTELIRLGIPDRFVEHGDRRTASATCRSRDACGDRNVDSKRGRDRADRSFLFERPRNGRTRLRRRARGRWIGAPSCSADGATPASGGRYQSRPARIPRFAPPRFARPTLPGDRPGAVPHRAPPDVRMLGLSIRSTDRPRPRTQ